MKNLKTFLTALMICSCGLTASSQVTLDSIQATKVIEHIDRLESDNEVRSSLITVLTNDRNECNNEVLNLESQKLLLKQANDAITDAFTNERRRADKNIEAFEKADKRARNYLYGGIGVVILLEALRIIF